MLPRTTSPASPSAPCPLTAMPRHVPSRCLYDVSSVFFVSGINGYGHTGSPIAAPAAGVG
eukprot:2368165-Rhodomonas_salina.2